MAGKSPTALAVAREALARARSLRSLEACLDQDLRVSCRFVAVPDFVEGIRAMVVDKDRSPRWSPAGHEGVTEAAVARHFADLGDGELGLAEPLSIIPHDDKVVGNATRGD
jgi:enoyl-CoA hydratase